MKTALMTGAVVALLCALTAPAISESAPESTACATHRHPAREQRVLAAHAFALGRWQHPELGPGNRRRMQTLRLCANPSALPAMRRSWREAKRRLYRYAALRRIAPYYGCGHWWAIPAWIVFRESRCEWGAANPSGAVGPYQLLGWGAPYPATTWREKMANHRIAAAVWNGGAGASNWACC